MLRATHGVFSRNAPGTTVCGDAVFVGEADGTALFAVIDGLGHGPGAHLSAVAVVETLSRQVSAPLPELFAACDRALTGKRGAVMGVLQLAGPSLVYACVGNVELLGPPGLSMPPSLPGIVGRGIRPVRTWPLPAAPGQRWALVSDGVRMRAARPLWQDGVPGDPARAATALGTAAGRDDDDVTALVLELAHAGH